MAGAADSSAFPFSPSPSPTFARSTDWHFPGPSSVFHKREKEASRHRRGESYTTPVAPVLSTERRAQHRRVKSSATFSGALSPLPSTPAGSEKSRSPLSRFASYTSETMASHGPLTPASKSYGSSRPGSKLQDSPFSDYFTDDGRSLNEYGYSAPSPEVQRVLLQLNKLQSQLMRGNDGEIEMETLGVVGKKLDSLELELNSLHSQTRMPPELEDSGLFMDEQDEEEKSATPSGLGVQYEGANDAEEPTKEQKQAENDYLLLQAQQVLNNVTKAQEQLKHRHAELREINDMHTTDMDEKDRQIEELKSENEGMRMDLNHDHSELLFLKLQFKALEVEFDALEDDDATPTRHQPARRKKLQDELDRWRSDWADVDGRMKRRRSQYGVVSPLSRRDSHAEGNTSDDEWKLETVKKGQGRVQSIMIRRTTSAGYPFDPDGATEEEVDLRRKRDTQQDDTKSETPSSPKPPYVHQTTQTESVPLAWLEEDEDDDGETNPGLEHDECAITTSSEASDTEREDFEGEGEVDHEVATPVKSPWQDLWDSLSSFAGMGDERFSD